MNKTIREKIKHISKYNELLKLLILRDVKIKYRRSYLGYLWSVLNPLMLMAIMIIVFSNLFRFEIENYPLYLLSAQILFSFMVESTNLSVGAILANAPLIKKANVPKFIFIVSKVGGALVNFLFFLIALVIVMFFTDAKFSLTLLFIPIVILELFLFSLGVSFFLSALSVFFRDIQYLWGVFVSMWMYFTPIFYPVSIIPESYQGLYKSLNPMYWYIEQFRQIVLFSELPEVSSVLLGFIIAIVVLILGICYFTKKEDEFILYI
ncbi:ABC transporter permease [Lonepinella sp. MS14437]|uniref:ABC transporter permease n=1 Tax=Lonepinella sp. MS14437 TaxID=3003620 RepID=UPI0036DE028A